MPPLPVVCPCHNRIMGSPDDDARPPGLGGAGTALRALPGVVNPHGARVWCRAAMWHETCTHADWLVALLNYVDNARDLLYTDEHVPGLVDVTAGNARRRGSARGRGRDRSECALRVRTAAEWPGSQVLRAHRIRLLSGRVSNGTEIAITSWLSRVGTKSYDISHEAGRGWRLGAERAGLVYGAPRTHTCRAPPQVYRRSDQRLLAQVTSTLVVVLDGRAVAMPAAERVRALAVARDTQPAVPADTARPPAAWSYRTVVRPSDADSLGHVNNAKYAWYVEDAKDAAVRAGVLPPTHAWSGAASSGGGASPAPAHETVELHVDYVGEVRPYDALDVYVWPGAEGPDTVGYDLVRDGAPVTRVRTAVKPLARL
jgi:acyl-CoA thioesterase FadM